MIIDTVIILIYLLIILSVGWLGWFRAKTREDYLVAGRRLGSVFFTSTMAATVLGGASTIGSIGLGYQYGISGLWLAASLGLGLIGLSLFLVSPLIRLRLYTVTQVFELQYRTSVRLVASVVMLLYDLMVAVTSTIAIGTVLEVLFHVPFHYAIWLGGGVVVAYAVLGGMWSLTMTDVLQFSMMTVGLMFILMPSSVMYAGGWAQMKVSLPASYFQLTAIGWPTIITYFLIYCLGIFIGQDIWQRVFTAKSIKVARLGVVSVGVYCILYGAMGAIIGMAGRVFLPELTNPDTTFAAVVQLILPVGIRGLVIAAALAALMSTASACLMATSTIGVHDLYASIVGEEKCSIRTDRIATFLAGIVMLMIASMIGNVIAALTFAYNLLVGALLIPLIGAIVWRKASSTGATWAIGSGAFVVISFMLKDGLMANTPIYFGLTVSLIVFITGSCLRPDPTKDNDLYTKLRRLKKESLQQSNETEEQ